MRMTNWLEDVFGSPLRVRVLRLLDRSIVTELTLREIARALGTGPSSVRVALEALQALGVVESRRLGNSNGYRLRKTKQRELLQRLFEAENDLEKVTEASIARVVPRGVSAFFFGSAARGTQTRTSDLDILVIAGDRHAADEAAARIRAATAEVGFMRPQTFALGKADLSRKRREPWLLNAKRDARHIAGPPLEKWT